jgi:hypothetical protein
LHCIAFVARATKWARVQCNATKSQQTEPVESVSAVSAEIHESQFIQIQFRFDFDSIRNAAPGLG